MHAWSQGLRVCVVFVKSVLGAGVQWHPFVVWIVIEAKRFCAA